MPTKDDLKSYAGSKYSSLIWFQDTINSESVYINNIPLYDWISAALLATSQDPSANSIVVLNTSPIEIIEMTNSDLLNMLETFFQNRIKYGFALKACFDAIDAETVTDNAGVDTLWDSTVSGYTAPNALPTIAELNARITALENA